MADTIGRTFYLHFRVIPRTMGVAYLPSLFMAVVPVSAVVVAFVVLFEFLVALLVFFVVFVVIFPIIVIVMDIMMVMTDFSGAYR